MKRIIRKSVLMMLVAVMLCSTFSVASAGLRSDSSSLKVPKGKLYANVWRGAGKNKGQTRKWPYVVSAKYVGKAKVKWIQTSWYSGAALRNGGGISVGAGRSSVRVGLTSKWKFIRTQRLYWKNSNGAKSADYSSNTMVAPRKYCDTGSIYTKNTGSMVVKGYPKKYAISAGI